MKLSDQAIKIAFSVHPPKEYDEVKQMNVMMGVSLGKITNCLPPPSFKGTMTKKHFYNECRFILLFYFLPYSLVDLPETMTRDHC